MSFSLLLYRNQKKEATKVNDEKPTNSDTSGMVTNSVKCHPHLGGPSTVRFLGRVMKQVLVCHPHFAWWHKFCKREKMLVTNSELSEIKGEQPTTSVPNSAAAARLEISTRHKWISDAYYGQFGLKECMSKIPPHILNTKNNAIW